MCSLRIRNANCWGENMLKRFAQFSATTSCIAAVAFASVVQAQTLRPAARDDLLVAQQPPSTPSLAALQTAINAKDAATILSIVDNTPKDQRGPLAALLLRSARDLRAADGQFAATLAALAYMSGGLSLAQQNAALIIIRDAPGGLAIVNTLVSNNLTGGFGLAITTAALFNLAITENPNQTQSSPN
jgi:hypothetical protein